MSTGSSNRLSYDDCDYHQRNTERVAPLQYQLYGGKYLTCSWCGVKNPNLTSELPFNDRVSIESDLRNIDRKQSRCDGKKYQPPCKEGTNCPLNNAGFINHIACERDVVWTNLVKPTGPGFTEESLNTFKCK
jgi:hypothetical protein